MDYIRLRRPDHQNMELAEPIIKYVVRGVCGAVR